MTFTVRLNSFIIKEIQNPEAQEFKDVWLFGSIQGRPSADVSVYDLEFYNIKDEDGTEITDSNERMIVVLYIYMISARQQDWL